MEIDLTVGLLIGAAFLFFVAIAFFVAKYQDIVWRAKTLRKYFKRNYVILERVSKDNKTRTSRIVNMDGDVFSVGNFMWVIKGGRIYRKDKENEGSRIGRNNISWEEGVPTITVDEDSIKPLDFYKEESNVRPEELGSTLSAWVMNQLAKGFAMIKNQDLWIKIIAVGVLINLLMSYATMDTVGKIQSDVKGLMGGTPAGTVVPAGGTVQNGSIVIKQGGAK